MARWTIDGYALIGERENAGLGPIPAAPPFPVYCPEGAPGARALTFWQLAHDNRLGCEVRPDNPLVRVDVRHGVFEEAPWVEVTTIPKLPETWYGPTEGFGRRGWGPTGVDDARMDVKLILVSAHLLPISEIKQETVPWEPTTISISDHRPVPCVLVRAGAGWGAVVDLDDIAIGVVATGVAPGSITLTPHPPVVAPDRAA